MPCLRLKSVVECFFQLGVEIRWSSLAVSTKMRPARDALQVARGFLLFGDFAEDTLGFISEPPHHSMQTFSRCDGYYSIYYPSCVMPDS
jgi:hypothetical protein